MSALQSKALAVEISAITTHAQTELDAIGAELGTLSNRLFQCESVLEAKRIGDAAQAIHSWTNGERASKGIADAAMRIRSRAELRLGELSSLLHRKQGRGHAPTGKQRQLLAAGIQPARANRAQRLAELPRADVEAFIETTPAPAPNTVAEHFGVRSRPEHVSVSWRAIAQNAIALLDKLVNERRVGNADVEKIKQLRDRAIALNVSKGGGDE